MLRYTYDIVWSVRCVDDMHQTIAAIQKQNIVYVIRYIPEFVLKNFELQHEHVKTTTIYMACYNRWGRVHTK